MRYTALPLLILVACALPASGAESAHDENVLITFRVGNSESGEDVVLKTYEMIACADGEPVEMTTGARVPIPTTSFKVSEDGTRVAAPVTSYTYQQIGFTAKMSVNLREDGSIQLRGRVEDSSLTGTPAADGRPFIQSMQQLIAVTLRDGEPLRINRVDEAAMRSFFIQVQAARVDGSGERIAAR